MNDTKACGAKVLGLTPYSTAGNLIGGLMIVASMTLFTVNDSLLKSLQQEVNPFGVETLPLPMIIAVRATLVVALLGLIALSLRQPVASRQMLLPWNLGRAGIETLITILFLSSLPFLPFAVQQTLISSNPIFLVFFGIFLFGERVGWRRWLAILIGLVGIVFTSLAIGGEGVQLGSASGWALIAVTFAAMLVALRDVATRYIGDGLPPTSVALTSAIAIMILGWTIAWTDWQVPNSTQLVMLFASAVLIAGAYLTAVFAVRLGTFAVIGPLRFISLVVAFAIGLLFFRDPFSWLGLWGAVLIVGSALWIVYRQIQTGRDG